MGVIKRRLIGELICLSFLIIIHEINALPTLRAPKSIHEELELSPRYKMTWTIDEGSDKIEFELIVQSTGFVGFGLSPTGGMDGADFIIVGVLENGTSYFSDRHGVGHKAVVDEHEDWELISIEELNGYTTIRVTRLLTTCDDQDLSITMDTSKLIFSYGDSDEIIHHGFDNRGTKSMNLLYPPKKADVSGFSNWTMTASTKIPIQETTYWCTFHKGPKSANGSQLYIVGWDSIMLGGNAAKYTHHLDLKKCQAPPGQSNYDTFERFVGKEGTSCYDEPGDYPIHYCETYVLTWAVGRALTLLPNDIGYAAPEGDAYYVLEVHYDNPQKDDIEPFVTGLEVYYTETEREKKADILGVGHYTTWSLIVPPMVKDFTVAGHCNPECTNYFPEEGITVFSGLMHSHLSGRKLKLRHFRDGKELPWISVDNNFDFNFQENKKINNVVIKAGDQITYECTYDTTWKNGSAVVSGIGSRDEMCVSWFWYYPRIEMNYCYSLYPYENTIQEFGIESYNWTEGAFSPPPIITAPASMAGKSYQEVLDTMVDWTPEKIAQIQHDHRFGDHFSFCYNGKTSEMYPISNPIVHYANIEEEYQPEDVCKLETPDPSSPVTPDPSSPVTPDPSSPVTPDPSSPVTPDSSSPVPSGPTTPDSNENSGSILSFKNVLFITGIVTALNSFTA